MSTEQPDWNLIAEKFDLWLPYIAPVGDQLLSRLGATPNEHILDVACGTGEPALTLARRLGDQCEIVCVDAAEGMVRAAKAKADKQKLSGIRFDTMPAEELDFPDNYFDRVMCRFGVMLFEDPIAGLAEMWRVLRPGGSFSLAVWGEPEAQSSFGMIAEVFDPLLPDDKKTPFSKITSMGLPGALDAALQAAGFGVSTITRHELHYTMESFEEYWSLLEESAILKTQLDALSSSQRSTVRDEIAHMAKTYHKEGKLVLPHIYLLVSGTK